MRPTLGHVIYAAIALATLIVFGYFIYLATLPPVQVFSPSNCPSPMPSPLPSNYICPGV